MSLTTAETREKPGETIDMHTSQNSLDWDGTYKGVLPCADPMAGMTFRSHKNQYDQILDAIQQNITPPVSGEESLQSLAVVEALYRSAGEGRLVRVEEILQ